MPFLSKPFILFTMLVAILVLTLSGNLLLNKLAGMGLLLCAVLSIISEERFHKDANRDQLTKILNRRGLSEAFVSLMTDRRCAGKNTALMIMDLDYFKNINDFYGHAAGDKMLREFAAMLSNVLRTDDIIARWGGEEFVVICNDITQSDAIMVAEKIRNAVQQSDFGVDRKMTVSIGLTVSMARTTDIEVAVAFADELLYKAKDNGRNRVEYSTASNPTPQALFG